MKSAAGQHRQAVETWKKVIALEPDVAQNYLDLAEALVKAGALEESLQYFVKTADMDGVAEVHLRLADVLARLGRGRESALARETYERLRLEDFRRRIAPISRLFQQTPWIDTVPELGVQSRTTWDTGGRGYVSSFSIKWRSMMRGLIEAAAVLAAVLVGSRYRVRPSRRHCGYCPRRVRRRHAGRDRRSHQSGPD